MTLWSIRCHGQIIHRTVRIDYAALETNVLFAAFVSDERWRPPPAPEIISRTECLTCPDCGADRGLTIWGEWGDAARLLCPSGHGWTPEPHDWAVKLLEDVILMQWLEP